MIAFRSPGLLVLGILAHLLAYGALATENDTVSFNRDVRPILADNCFACHGPDSGNRQSDLRLDTKERAFEDLGGYHAIVSGDVDSSELITRILSDDPADQMPPASHRKQLSQAQKDILVQWVEQGASWEEHWAWLPPQPAETPSLDSDWPKNPIDQFVLQRMRAQGLSPADEATRRILIRRLYFDLVGLPPSWEEVQEFVDNEKDYEQVVDSLLESPHFGERLAIYWLDVVRYADTVGYHGDQEISISPYRDYVIDAFNNNLPFDQFTREQLAGDLLPEPTLQQKIASGYNRLGMMSAEGGVQPEEYLAKYAADRVRTTASVWLGVTLGCAECHDHKFDPFSIKDFYRFASFFADIKERGLYSGANSTGDWGPKVEVPDDGLNNLLAPFDAQLAELNRQLDEQRNSLGDEQAAWEKELRTSYLQWQPLQVIAAHSVSGATLEVDAAQQIQVGGKLSDKDTYVVHLELPDGLSLGELTGLRLEAMPIPDTAGSGRSSNGNFVLTECVVLPGVDSEIAALSGNVQQWTSANHIRLHDASATFEQTQSGGKHPDKRWSAASAIDRDKNGDSWGWAVLPNVKRPQAWVCRMDTAALAASNQNADDSRQIDKARQLTLVLQQNHGKSHTLGRFRLSVSATPEPSVGPQDLLPPEIRSILLQEAENRKPGDSKVLADYFFGIAPSLGPLREKISKLNQQREQTRLQHTRTSLVTLAVNPREFAFCRAAIGWTGRVKLSDPRFRSCLLARPIPAVPQATMPSRRPGLRGWTWPIGLFRRTTP